MRIGVARLHSGREIAQIHVCRETGNVVLGVERMHVLAKIAQPHTLILFMLLTKLGQDAPHRLVAVVVVFELLQSGQQRVPTPFGNADREHDEEAVETRLFNNHTMFRQKLRHDAGGNTGVVKLAVQI